MKLTSQQLKNIISEEVKKLRLETNALQVDSNVTQIKNNLSNVEGGPAFEAAVGRVRETWNNFYSDEDPSMEASGLEGWSEQVDRACEELSEKIADLVVDIGNSLLDGEYGS